MPREPFGKYTLLSRLGSGGMAEVFLARAQSIGGFQKLLAIKRLLPFCTQDQETVDLLADEARITVRLTHPNIVQVFDFGRVADSYYIAMEYVDGLDLKSLVRIDELTSEPMDPKLALYVTGCVLEALYFAHTQSDGNGTSLGIIHRDVSPHNVLISRHGEVKLTDFGVARAAISSHVTRVGDIRGKFSYMPPEQVWGGEIDHRIDIFAAGAVFYELLSGRQPYRAASADEQLQLLRLDMPPPSVLRPGLPPALDAICMRALDKDPAKRFASAGEFAAELRDQTARWGGPMLPPTALLAALVEQRLAQQAAESPRESSEVMGLRDYGAGEDSLIRFRHGEVRRLPAAQAAPFRQTRRDRAVRDQPPSSNDGFDDLPLLTLQTHVEARPPGLRLDLGVGSGPEPAYRDALDAAADPEDSDTLVTFALPDRLPDEGPSIEPTSTPRRPSSRGGPSGDGTDRRGATGEASTVVDDLQATLAEHSYVAAEPMAAHRVDDSLASVRGGEQSLPRETLPARRQGWGHVAMVLAVSFAVGVAVTLAVVLATC